MSTATKDQSQLQAKDWFFTQREAVEAVLTVSDATLAQQVINLLQAKFERASMRVELLLHYIDSASPEDRLKCFAFALGMWDVFETKKETGDEPTAIGVSQAAVMYWVEQHQEAMGELMKTLEGKPLMEVAERILLFLAKPEFQEKNGQARLAIATMIFDFDSFVPYWQETYVMPTRQEFHELVVSLRHYLRTLALLVKRNHSPMALAHHVRFVLANTDVSDAQKTVLLASVFSLAEKRRSGADLLSALVGYALGHHSGHDCADEDTPDE